MANEITLETPTINILVDYAANNKLSLKDFREFSDDLVRLRDNIKLTGQEYHPLASIFYDKAVDRTNNKDDLQSQLDGLKKYALDFYVRTLTKQEQNFPTKLCEKMNVINEVRNTQLPYGFSNVVLPNNPQFADAINIMRTFGNYKGKELENKIKTFYKN